MTGKIVGEFTLEVGELRVYANGILTKTGQQGIAEFMVQIAVRGEIIRDIATEALAGRKTLDVIVGYHGSPGGSGDFPPAGRFSHPFSQTEQTMVQGFFNSNFQNMNVRLVLQTTEPSDDEIKAAIRRGYTFFAWCNSDDRVAPMIISTKMEDIIRGIIARMFA